MNVDKNFLLYFDAEWVPMVNTYSALSDKYPDHADAWDHKCEKWNKDLELDGKKIKSHSRLWDEKAHWFPEFCKIICISFGFYQNGVLEVKSVFGDDEKELLTKFQHVLNKVATKGFTLCGYAIKRFDMPWIAKRMAINGITPPKNISVYGQKPWEVNVFDLPEVWGQGCKGEEYTPFEWACVSMGVESPKGDISGADVQRVYYTEGERGLERIKDYCEKDVVATAKLADKLITTLP